ncbi:MAG TPA: Rossmann-like and DUF2520 domain-containing protein [Candidatus Limnocylindrales bacterium]|nr:Rossmann-like and DUF2520 domain-containing protein [Candidatus Limnocylindrales bacterium]
MNKPTIAIVGPGRAGSTLARALRSAGYHVAAIAGLHPEHVRELAFELTARPVETPAAAAALAELTILAVPDDRIGLVAQTLSQGGVDLAGKSVVHLSGAQDRTVLDAVKLRGASVGVFHPLQTFRKAPEATHNLPGTLFGIDADPPLREQLEAIARDLGGEPFDLAGVNRPVYHAAAVLVANYAITLLAEATALMEEAGIDRKTAYRGLTRLLLGSSRNSQQVDDPAQALTGPAARGDAGTVARHLRALGGDPELQEIYRLMAERTTSLARKEER